MPNGKNHCLLKRLDVGVIFMNIAIRLFIIIKVALPNSETFFCIFGDPGFKLVWDPIFEVFWHHGAPKALPRWILEASGTCPEKGIEK